MPSLSTLKARAQGHDTTVVDPVLEAAKALPRIDKARCIAVENRQEVVKRSMKRVVKDGPKAAAHKQDEKTYTVYIFAVTDEHNTTWQVAKRFSEIREFKQELVKSGADIVKGWELPSKVPVKKSQKKLNDATIADRRQKLETFLSLSVSFFGKHPVVKCFLASDENRHDLEQYRPIAPGGGYASVSRDSSFGSPTSAVAAAQSSGWTSSPGEGLFQSVEMKGSQNDPDYELALALSRSESDSRQASTQVASVLEQSNEEHVMRAALDQSEREEAARRKLAEREAAEMQAALRASQGLTQPLFFEPGAQDDEENERPLQRQSPSFSGDPTGRMALVTVDSPATNAAALNVQKGDVVQVVAVASANWWTVRTDSGEGFVSPKVLQVMSDDAAAQPAAVPVQQSTSTAERSFLIMVAQNEHVAIGRKLKLSCADLAGLLQQIQEQLSLEMPIVIAAPVDGPSTPTPYQTFAEVPGKVKVQVWPADQFQAAPAPLPAEAPASEPALQPSSEPALQPATASVPRDFVLMVAQNPVVVVGRKLKLTASTLKDLKQQIGAELQLSGPIDIAKAVPASVEPTMLTSLEQLESKAKVQVWQSPAAAISEGVPPAGATFYDEATQRRVSMTKEFTKLREDIAHDGMDSVEDPELMAELMAQEEAQAEEDARIAQEQAAAAAAAQREQEAREQEAARIAQEQADAAAAAQRELQAQERARLEEEMRQKVLAEQAQRAQAEESKRQAEAEAARVALEAERARIEAQQEATRKAQEAAVQERAAMAEERARLAAEAAALEEAKTAAALVEAKKAAALEETKIAMAAVPKTPDYNATSSSASELQDMRASQLQARMKALSARDPRLGVEMVLQRSPRTSKDQATKALQESGGDVDKAVALLGSPSAGGETVVTESNEMRSFVLMVTPSDLVPANRMLRVQASSLSMLKDVLSEKLSVALPDGAADVSMLEPGRKDPTHVTSLDQLPNKAKVQLWPAGKFSDGSADAAADVGQVFKLTIVQSPDFAADGTVIEVSATDLAMLHEAIGKQLGRTGVQMLMFEPDFEEFCKPDSLQDVKPECDVKLATA